MPKTEKPVEAMNEMEDIDVTQRKAKVITPRPRPGEETERFVSNGRQNVLVKLGVEVEVPYWVWERLRESNDAELVAYNYETATEKRSNTF